MLSESTCLTRVTKTTLVGKKKSLLAGTTACTYIIVTLHTCTYKFVCTYCTSYPHYTTCTYMTQCAYYHYIYHIIYNVACVYISTSNYNDNDLAVTQPGLQFNLPGSSNTHHDTICTYLHVQYMYCIHVQVTYQYHSTSSHDLDL